MFLCFEKRNKKEEMESGEPGKRKRKRKREEKG